MISFFRKLVWLTRHRRKEDQLTAELQFHLEQEAEERQSAGMAAQEARWAARRELGNLSVVREDTRATWSWPLLEQILQDLRYAARTNLRNPAFTILAVLSLALGIGANAAIYSFMDALLMRTLPVSDPRSLVVLNWHVAGKKRVDDSVVHNVSGQINDDPKTGADDCVRGVVRDYFVRRGPAYGRDRHTHGPRGAAHNRSLDGAARSPDTCGSGSRHQSAGGTSRVETGRVSSIRGQAR